MGEYILLDGVPNKIGTCEDLFYCRYTDLVEWIAAGRASFAPNNEEPADYLAGGYRFRFPFPDEDGPESARLATYAAEFDRGVLIPYPSELLLADIDHSLAYAEITPYAGRHKRQWGYQTRAWMLQPCPLGAATTPAAPHASHVEALSAPRILGAQRYEDRGPWVELVEQRPLDGQLWAIFRCPFCATRWRLPQADAVKVAAYAQETAPELELAETMRRMLAGYDGLPGGA